MAEEHIYDRYDKAIRLENEAHSKVDALADRVREVGQKLHRWREIGFSGKLPDGSHVTAMSERVIKMDELPTTHDLYEAIQEWRRLQLATQGIVQSMTMEQRQRVRATPG